MAKRIRTDEARITLFPFLSILACVIGTLVLLITAVAMSQMGARPDDEVVRRAEAFALLSKQEQADAARRTELQELLARLRELQAELDRLRAEAQRLQDLDRQIKDALVRVTERERLLAEKLRLEQELAALDAEYRKLLGLLKPLQEELARRKEVPTESVVKVEPGGSGAGAHTMPAFVETDATGLVLHGDGAPERVPVPRIGSHAGFLAVLDRGAGNAQAIVVFLVRSDGLAALKAAESVAAARGARSGRLPIPGHGALDLSLFRNR